jgi:hypothetical protein
MKLLRRGILSAVACLTVAPPIAAAETLALSPALGPALAGANPPKYWVDNTAKCGETCNGTKEKPWLTIKKAAAEVKPVELGFTYVYVIGHKEGPTYKEGTIELKNGEATKGPIDFLGEGSEAMTCTVWGNRSQCPKVEGEFRVTSSNVDIVFINISNTKAGPCVAAKAGLMNVAVLYDALGPCKSEPFANWFSSEVKNERNTLASEAGWLKMRPDTASFSEEENEEDAWLNENTSVLKSYPTECCGPRQWQNKGTPKTELLEPVTTNFDWPAYESKYAPLQLGAVRRETFVNEKIKAEAQKQGFAGVMLDDVNWQCLYRDQYQEGSSQIAEGHNREEELKAKYGNGYTPAACTEKHGEPELKAERELIAAVRTQLKSGAILEINSHPLDVWPLLKANPTGKCGAAPWKEECEKVEAALKEVNIVTSEHGLAAGTTSGVAEYLEYWKALHGMGLHSVFAGPFFVPYDSTKEGVTEAELDADQEYNLAAYFLTTDGGDFVTEWGHTQPAIWAGVKKALSKPLGKAQALEGPDANKVYKRKFANGTVYLDPPGGASEKQKCKESKEWGEAEREITLTAERGAVCHS